jgi:hypothetical protein
MILCRSWSEKLMDTKASGFAMCRYACLFVQAVWLPAVTRDGDWQCDTQRIADGGESVWITKKNQFLPYVYM